METINTYYKDYSGLNEFVANNRELLLAKDNRAVLVQVFSGICDKDVLVEIAKQIIELVPGAQVIGTTTNGEIINGKISGLRIAISFSIFKLSGVKIAFVAKNDLNDFDLGRAIGRTAIGDKARVLILFATGLTVNGAQILKGIQSVNASLPVAGGNAGDNLENTQCFVFTHENITDCGVAGAFLLGDNIIASRYSHLGWQAIGKEMLVTRAEGSRVYTIDHVPAYQIYCRYLSNDEPFDILNSIEFPLYIAKHGMVVLRVPFVRYEDDSLAFFGEIEEGERVRFSFGHIPIITEMIDSLLQSITQKPVESIFVYSCAARRSLLGETAQIETRPLQNIAPTAGFFTSGEFFHADNSNYFLNNTMTVLTLSETGVINNLSNRKSFKSSGDYGINVASDRDNVANRSAAILKALSCLVGKVTDELNERTSELELANEQLLYNSSHDALTGLYNRCFFEKKIRSMKTGTIGIIMCDVDGLKMINDSFGHTVGDELLKNTADILRPMFEHKDVVARIGGDEFAVLLHNSNPLRLEIECNRIRDAVNLFNQSSSVVPLSISIGASCREDELTDIHELLKNADDKMYREKLERSNSIRSDLVQSLMSTLEARKILNEESSRRFQNLFMSFAGYIGIPHNKLADMRLFARFHDIGKVGISDQVLFLPHTLDPEQRVEMEKHCEIGYRIARTSTDLLPIADWIMSHHEWWDGNGYPLGLKGAGIPLECRILAVVKAFDDMTNDHPYRTALHVDAALEEIKFGAGTQFDPTIAEAFIKWFRTFREQHG